MGLFLGKKISESAQEARKHHPERVKDAIRKLTDGGYMIELDKGFETTLVTICEGHSRKRNIMAIPDKVPVEGLDIRQRLLAAILRIADASDIDHRRAPHALFGLYEEAIPKDSKEHWQKHQHITGVSFRRELNGLGIYVTFSDSLSELIEQYRLTDWVLREIKDELRSVRSVFQQYLVPVYNAQLIDRKTDEVIDVDSSSYSNLCTIVLRDSTITDNGIKDLEVVLKSSPGSSPVLIILLTKYGKIDILLPETYNISFSFELQGRIELACPGSNIHCDITETTF
jgi:hypothetical protein